MTLRPQLIGLAFLTLVGACETTAPPDREIVPTDTSSVVLTVTRDTAAPIQTDTLSYELRWDGVAWRTTIRFEFRNVTPDTVYFINCGRQLAVRLEKRIDNAWVSSWSAPLLGCLSPPVIILPGAASLETFELFGAPAGGNVYPQFTTADPAGIYRIVWYNLVWHNEGAGGVPVPPQYRYSNSFVLVRTS